MKKWTKWLLLLAAVILAAVFGRKAQASGTSSIIFDTDKQPFVRNISLFAKHRLL